MRGHMVHYGVLFLKLGAKVGGAYLYQIPLHGSQFKLKRKIWPLIGFIRIEPVWKKNPAGKNGFFLQENFPANTLYGNQFQENFPAGKYVFPAGKYVFPAGK